MAPSTALSTPSRRLANPMGEVTQLLVSWQHPVSRRYEAVGVLSYSASSYKFHYLPSADSVPGFRPLLGFSDLRRVYRSPHLFPLFGERVLDADRPDRPRILEALDLTPEAGPMEFLARSGGRRAGDTLELLPIPLIRDGHTTFTFLVHGVRHQDGAHERIDQLVPGELLTLILEPANPVDSRAILVASGSAEPLGWVPHPLLDLVHAMCAAGTPTVTVVRANPREFGHHLRLLVRLEGAVPAGYQTPWGRD